MSTQSICWAVLMVLWYVSMYTYVYIHIYICTHMYIQIQHRYEHVNMCRRCDDNQQITVSHFGEHKRLHLESSKQNYYIIALRVIIKEFFTCVYMYIHIRQNKYMYIMIHTYVYTYTCGFSVCVWVVKKICVSEWYSHKYLLTQKRLWKSCENMISRSRQLKHLLVW